MLAQLSEERPDNLRVRLDRTAVLFALGRDDEAGELFREARRQPDLPPEGRRRVEGFLARILARQRLRVDLDLELRYDGNVNNAAEVEAVAFPVFGNLVFTLDDRPVGAWVARTGAERRPDALAPEALLAGLHAGLVADRFERAAVRPEAAAVPARSAQAVLRPGAL